MNLTEKIQDLSEQKLPTKFDLKNLSFSNLSRFVFEKQNIRFQLLNYLLVIKNFCVVRGSKGFKVFSASQREILFQRIITENSPIDGG